MNIFQNIKKYNSAIIFIVFILGAVAVFIFSFFSSPELVVALRVITFIILLIPFAIVFLIKPIFALLFEAIQGDDYSSSSLRIDDPKSKDWLFSDERLYGKSINETLQAMLRRYYPKPSPEASEYEIESDTKSWKKRFSERRRKPFEEIYSDFHTELLKDYMVGEKLAGIEKEEERVYRLKQNPRFSYEIMTIDRILDNLDVKDEKIHITSKGIAYTFDFDSNHKFSIFIGGTLKLSDEDEVIIEVIFRKYQPFSLSLINLEEEENESKDRFDKYSIHTTHSLDHKRILTKEKIKDYLVDLHPQLNRLVINEKFLSLILKDEKGVMASLELAKEIYEEFLLLDFGVAEINEVTCYSCDTIFQRDVEKCQKCGTLRPKCIVCSLDLFPSEKEKIIKTPCCGVLAHKEHIIMWLKKKETCPNCKKALSRWLNKLEN